MGGTLTGIGGVAALALVVRNDGSVDVDVASVLVAVSVLVLFLAWVVGRVLFFAGRPAAMVGVLAAAVAVGCGGITVAAILGPGHLAARDVPVPLLGLGLLVPGVVVLVVANRMPQPTLRQSWDDAEWLRRFRGGLRARLVPAATAREHVAEIGQALGAGAAPAFAEFGHPLVLAHALADADKTARARRWWLSTVAGAGPRSSSPHSSSRWTAGGL